MKNILSSFYILFATLLLLTSCEKTVLIDPEQVPERVVIDALVTDREDFNYVKVHKTVDFYFSETPPAVTNATVTVEDDAGNIVNYVHYSGQNSDSVGYYLPETPFAGVIGRTYTLIVVVDGQTYTAQDQLLRLVPIDKLDYRIDEDEFEDPEDPGRYYELLLFVKEPQETKDYYLFKSVRNGKVEYQTETDVYFSDDELISENIDGVPLPVYYAEGDVAGAQVFSLTRDGFIYYRDLQKLLTNDGGLFGTPPANPRTNISNGAVGLFQVSALQTSEIIIQ